MRPQVTLGCKVGACRQDRQEGETSCAFKGMSFAPSAGPMEGDETCRRRLVGDGPAHGLALPCCPCE